jgi:hypothetical protein
MEGIQNTINKANYPDNKWVMELNSFQKKYK